mgnify:CR=1 FL=1
MDNPIRPIRFTDGDTGWEQKVSGKVLAVSKVAAASRKVVWYHADPDTEDGEHPLSEIPTYAYYRGEDL